MQTFHGTECIRAPIGCGLVRRPDETAPSAGDKVERGLLHVGMALGLELAQKVQGRQHRLARLGAVKCDDAQQGG